MDAMQRLVKANVWFAVSFFFAAFAGASVSEAEPYHQLNVIMSQANNASPYPFVRAKFEPGEIGDSWAVRFFDQHGTEVPYFVWDSITWQVARDGRPDWGNRYALLNHHPGNAPEALQM